MIEIQLFRRTTSTHSEPFEEAENARVITCVSDASDSAISSASLVDPRNNSLVSVNLRSSKCQSSTPLFTSCDRGQDKVILKAVINDLKKGEIRTYGCDVVCVTAKGNFTKTSYVNVTSTEEGAYTEQPNGIIACSVEEGAYTEQPNGIIACSVEEGAYTEQPNEIIACSVEEGAYTEQPNGIIVCSVEMWAYTEQPNGIIACSVEEGAYTEQPNGIIACSVEGRPTQSNPTGLLPAL
ncbi:hypothetical protein ACOMHN_029306 [Nucella lapillus]